MLLGPSKHGGAAGTTIEPDDDGIGRGASAGEGSNVVQFLLGACNGEVARVETEGDIGLLPKFGDTVSLGVSSTLSSCQCDKANY